MRYESYEILNFEIKDGEPRLQIKNPVKPGSQPREVFLAVARNRTTSELQLDVVPHFTDPESAPWWPDSEPWPRDEMQQEKGLKVGDR